MLLHDHCEAVANASTREEFQAVLVRFAQELGFSTISASAIYDLPHDENEAYWVDNTPDAYRPIFEDRSFGRLDPVMQHAKHNSRPIIWDQATYVRVGRADRWEIQAEHGYQTGIAMALHLPNGRHFFVGVDRDRALPHHRPDELSRMVADFTSVLMYAQETAFRVMPRLGAHARQGCQRTMATKFLLGSPICLPEGYMSPRFLRTDALMRPDWFDERDCQGRKLFKARFHKPIH